MKKIIIVGSGIAGMSAAAVLASKGYDVTVLEKNDKAGGRINFFEHDDFIFEMGPSWYWMPEVFENFYQRFGKTSSDFYNLKRLDPSYKVVFDKDQAEDIPADINAFYAMFEKYDPGSSKRLKKFLDQAETKYRIGMDEFVWKPGLSLTEFMSLKVLKNAFQLQLLSSIASEIKKVTKHDKLRQILEFPVLFLGATPNDTPALYSLMNYADIRLGTWYPEGGMYKIAEAFLSIAKEQGAKFIYNEEVTTIDVHDSKVKKVKTLYNSYDCDAVICNGDYNHFDQKIVPSSHRNYDDNYWDSRKMAPSSLLAFVGLNQKVQNLEHHNLFFDADFDKHAFEIYKKPQWPSDPLFYVCMPSKTDNNVAAEGHENLFILMPLAPDLDDSDETVIEHYFNLIMDRVESYTGEHLKDKIIFKKFFCVKDFKSLYNSYKGNAYGLANTLMQTATLKPSLKSKKLTNLYYCGQLTVPGPGLPPSIISGQLAADEVIKRF